MYFRYNENINLGFNFMKLLILRPILLICHYLFGGMLTKQKNQTLNRIWFFIIGI